MTYRCKTQKETGSGEEHWNGEIKNLKQKEGIIEAEITGRGTVMHIIIGEYEYGRYLCIPGRQVGSELAGLKDVFWNREQLARQIGIIDAITVAEALNVIENELESMA